MTYDAKWDRRLGIRTAGRDAAAEDAHHRAYEPTPYAVLERLAGSGWIGPGNLLVDYGCGKGRVSLFLSRETGCRSIGIDFNPALVAAAEENRRSVTGRADAVFLVRAAEKWDVPPDADRFYFFNPFSAGSCSPSFPGSLRRCMNIPGPFCCCSTIPRRTISGC